MTCPLGSFCYRVFILQQVQDERNRYPVTERNPACVWLTGVSGKQLPGRQLVLQIAKGHSVKAAIAGRFQPLEYRLKVDVALAGVQVDFLIAVVVGQPHLADARNAKGIEKAVNALRYQVGMVDGESPAETL